MHTLKIDSIGLRAPVTMLQVLSMGYTYGLTCLPLDVQPPAIQSTQRAVYGQVPLLQVCLDEYPASELTCTLQLALYLLVL
jgi:hypothetical protein